MTESSGDDRYAKYNDFAGPSDADLARAEARAADMAHHSARRNVAQQRIRQLKTPGRNPTWGSSSSGTPRHYR